MKWMKLDDVNFNKTNLIKALREAKCYIHDSEERKEISRLIRSINNNYGNKAGQEALDKDSYVIRRIIEFTYYATVVELKNVNAMLEISGWILDNFNWEVDTFCLFYYQELRKWDLC